MRKLFRNCPRGRRLCNKCPRLKHCKRIKARHRTAMEEEALNAKNSNLLYAIMTIMLAIFAIVFFLMFADNEETPNETSTVTEAYIQTETVQTNDIAKNKLLDEKVLLSCLVEETYLVEETSLTETEPIPQNEKVPEISSKAPSEDYYYIITSEEKKALEKLVYKEARGEPYEGQVAVAAVVMNRYVSDNELFDRTSVITVIEQSGQFADISDVTQEDLEEYPDCKNAVEDTLKGWDPTRVEFENGAYYFYNPNYVEGYEKEIRENLHVLSIGNHNFHESL